MVRMMYFAVFFRNLESLRRDMLLIPVPKLMDDIANSLVNCAISLRA